MKYEQNILENNFLLKEKYTQYMKSLFDTYSYLEKAGIPFEVYSEVKPNPTIKNVTDGIET